MVLCCEVLGVVGDGPGTWPFHRCLVCRLVAGVDVSVE